uniref:Uncharacterized protein n=1 Tax=Strongyloides venezuelensis TaxID=75913 RepID=A0A0K0FM66_STRVS
MNDRKKIARKKRSLRSRLPQSTGEVLHKNTKLKDKNVKNIDKVSKRRNIAESCKAFNILCNNKESYAESFKYENDQRYIIHYSIIKTMFIAFDDVLVIGI